MQEWRNILYDRSHDWEERALALEAAKTAVCKCLVPENPSVKQFATDLSILIEPLCEQVKELRSQVPREACSFLSTLMRQLRLCNLASFSTAWISATLPWLFKNLAVTIKVISVTAHEVRRPLTTQCIKDMIKFGLVTRDPLMVLLDGLKDKHKVIRAGSAKYVALYLESSSYREGGLGPKDQQGLMAAVRLALADADEAVRVSARRAATQLNANGEQQ